MRCYISGGNTGRVALFSHDVGSSIISCAQVDTQLISAVIAIIIPFTIAQFWVLEKLHKFHCSGEVEEQKSQMNAT